jgi:acylphosphatase
MSDINVNQPQTASLTFYGDVGAQDFLDWIAHRANKLGLVGWVKGHDLGQSVEVLVSGSVDLIDAMELGCSLGPESIWVETINRQVHNNYAPLEGGFKIINSSN